MRKIKTFLVLILLVLSTDFIYAYTPDIEEESSSVIEIPIKPTTGTLHRGNISNISAYYIDGVVYFSFMEIHSSLQILITNISTGEFWVECANTDTLTIMVDLYNGLPGTYIIEVMTDNGVYIGTFIR